MNARQWGNTPSQIIPKKKVALQPWQQVDVSAGLDAHYQPGMRLTNINHPVPVNLDYSSSDSCDSAQLEDDFTEGLYTYGTSERDLTSNLEEPFSQQKTLPSKISAISTNTSFVSMLQQQQALLQQLLDGQKCLEEKQDCFEDQLTQLASKVEQTPPTIPSSSGNKGKKKDVVTRTLSVSHFHNAEQ